MVLPLLVLAIPILDTALVTVRRLLEGRPVTQGGRDHASHRLVYYGLSERKAVALLAVVATAVGATAVAYNILNNPRVTILGVLVTFVLLVQFASFLTDLEERHAARGAASDARAARALFVQPRRLVEVVVDFGCICVSFLAAYLLFVGGYGTMLPARRLPGGAADPARDSLSRSRRVRRLPSDLALRRRPRRGCARRGYVPLRARRAGHPSG